MGTLVKAIHRMNIYHLGIVSYPVAAYPWEWLSNTSKTRTKRFWKMHSSTITICSCTPARLIRCFARLPPYIPSCASVGELRLRSFKSIRFFGVSFVSHWPRFGFFRFQVRFFWRLLWAALLAVQRSGSVSFAFRRSTALLTDEVKNPQMNQSFMCPDSVFPNVN